MHSTLATHLIQTNNHHIYNNLLINLLRPKFEHQEIILKCNLPYNILVYKGWDQTTQHLLETCINKIQTISNLCNQQPPLRSLVLRAGLSNNLQEVAVLGVGQANLNNAITEVATATPHISQPVLNRNENEHSIFHEAHKLMKHDEFVVGK